VGAERCAHFSNFLAARDPKVARPTSWQNGKMRLSDLPINGNQSSLNGSSFRSGSKEDKFSGVPHTTERHRALRGWSYCRAQGIPNVPNRGTLDGYARKWSKSFGENASRLHQPILTGIKPRHGRVLLASLRVRASALR